MSAKARRQKVSAAEEAPPVITVTEPASPDQAISSAQFLTEQRALLLLVAVTLLVYANSLGGEFVFDDPKQIVGNPQIHAWDNLLHAFTRDVWDFQRGTFTNDVPPPYYRPLFTIWLTLGWKLFANWTPGWHLLNLGVHTAATLAVYYLLRRLSENWKIAAFAALLFSVHPAHVESVSWISGIPDPLAALFYVPAFLWYVRYREENQKKWLLASVAGFAAAILCKETAFALPLIIAVWEFRAFSDWQAYFKRVFVATLPYAAVGMVYLLVRFAVLGRLSWKHPMMANVPDSAILMTVPYVVMTYLQHLFAPFHLSIVYGTAFIKSAGEWRFWLPVLLLVSATVALIAGWKKTSPEVRVSLALLIAPLLPVLNLKVFHQEYIIQDRYLYLPSIGFCWLAALLLMRLMRTKAALMTALAASLIVAFGASTILQNRVWRDSTTIWLRARDYAPHFWSVHYNLGLAYLERKNYEAAHASLLEARRLEQNVPIIWNNLALAQLGLKDIGNALTSLNHALKLDPRQVDTLNNLGTILFNQGNHRAAFEHFLRAIEINPQFVAAHFNAARAAAASGDHPTAIKHYETVLTSTPNDTEARYQLALSHHTLGQHQQAETHLTAALRQETNNERAAEMRDLLTKLQQSIRQSR